MSLIGRLLRLLHLSPVIGWRAIWLSSWEVQALASWRMPIISLFSKEYVVSLLRLSPSHKSFRSTSEGKSSLEQGLFMRIACTNRSPPSKLKGTLAVSAYFIRSHAHGQQHGWKNPQILLVDADSLSEMSSFPLLGWTSDPDTGQNAVLRSKNSL